ncbi:MAG: hypothetical protein JW768_09880 [Chitinispirillaceae bacterium]|nr:hypothetical protein [Chitinispirillaceae bacterium]
MRGIIIVSLMMACMAGVAVQVTADVYLKQHYHTDAYTIKEEKVPAIDYVSTAWYSKNRARIDHTADTTILFNFDTKNMTMLCHKSKTYTEMPVMDVQSLMKQSMGDDEMDDEAKKQMAAMMEQMTAMMKPTFTVKATAEKKKIRKWNALKYLLTTSIAGVTMDSEVWASPDIKVDYKLYNNFMNMFLTKIPGLDEVTKEMEKINGFMVRMIISNQLQGMPKKSTIELLEIKEKAPPPKDGYDIPAGYKKIKL